MNSNLKNLLERYDASSPLERAETIPAEWYFDSEIARLEQQNVFAKSWQFAARCDQVASAGQFATAEIAGEPVVVVRGTDGVLRAFFNVCRHHAAAVATEPAGQAGQLRCPYHGWTYGLDGALKGMPEFEGVCDFDRARNGLVPVRVEAWENFVFVNLDSRAASLSDSLGELSRRTAEWTLRELQFAERRSYTLRCNWKVYVDNYLDGGYHVPHLHKGLNSVLDYAHYTIENLERMCIQSSPLRANSASDAAAAATRRGDFAHYVWLYPNFMLNWCEGVMDTNLVIPRGTDRCEVIFDFYFAPSAAGSAADESIRVSERIQDEDVAICESVQRGLHSRAYRAGRLSVRREAGEHLFHQLLAADLKSSNQRSS
ncbi:MAG: aromatic ring-hydroxylating oxygenase subunit alpha [Candidatus Acidiferrales bacterium]